MLDLSHGSMGCLQVWTELWEVNLVELKAVFVWERRASVSFAFYYLGSVSRVESQAEEGRRWWWCG